MLEAPPPCQNSQVPQVSITEWVFGIISGLSVIAIAALFRMAIENEHRITVLETQYEHIDEGLDRIIEKLDRPMRGSRST
jgi:hypothetical protein